MMKWRAHSLTIAALLRVVALHSVPFFQASPSPATAELDLSGRASWASHARGQRGGCQALRTVFFRSLFFAKKRSARRECLWAITLRAGNSEKLSFFGNFTPIRSSSSTLVLEFPFPQYE